MSRPPRAHQARPRCARRSTNADPLVKLSAATDPRFRPPGAPNGLSMRSSHRPSGWRRTTSEVWPDIETGPSGVCPERCHRAKTSPVSPSSTFVCICNSNVPFQRWKAGECLANDTSTRKHLAGLQAQHRAGLVQAHEAIEIAGVEQSVHLRYRLSIVAAIDASLDSWDSAVRAASVRHWQPTRAPRQSG